MTKSSTAVTESMTHRQQIGQLAEDRALAYLQAKGLQLRQRNFRCRLGEIDLIMHDNDYLVFVEVRYRQSRAYGGALASVTPSKQQRLIRAAQVYLQQPEQAQVLNDPMRFDVLALAAQQSEQDMIWIPHAFTL
ncbi:MAG: YraN family protein [bacterium]